MLTIQTITERADFVRLNRAHKSVTPFFIVRTAPTMQPLSGCRVGFTVTTKCGNAVVRNRTKRRLRALVRELLPQHGRAGYDYVFIALAQAKPSTADVDYPQLREAMVRALTHSGRA